MSPPVQIAFRGHECRDGNLLLLFAVSQGSCEGAASVLVNPRTGSAQFPHCLCSSGTSCGTDVDAALLARSHQMIAVFDVAATWADMRSTSTMRRVA